MSEKPKTFIIQTDQERVTGPLAEPTVEYPHIEYQTSHGGNLASASLVTGPDGETLFPTEAGENGDTIVVLPTFNRLDRPH